MRATLAAVVVLLLVAVGVIVTIRRDVVRLSAQVEQLSVELEDTRRQLAEAESEAPAAEDAPAGLGDLFGGLLGGEGGEGLEGLLGGLLGEGGEGLGGLLGGGGADLTACLAGGGAGLPGLGAAVDPIDGADAAAQIEDITERVEDLREIERREELDVAFLSSADIEARVAELVREDYPAEEADLDRRQLAALGAIPADLDLAAVQAELVSGQVAGFYEPETGELVVRSDDPNQPLGPTEQITLAHEVEHALADQELGLDVDNPDQQTDPARAALAVVEGDATLTMQQFSLGAFDLNQQLALAGDPEVLGSQQQLASFPHYLSAQLTFSYLEGLNFVCDRFSDGGWEAVEAAYAQRPNTTAEILFPERYPLAAAAPRAPGSPGGAWREARSDSFGAADLLWLFEAPGDDQSAALDDPRGRAGDWAGGRLALHTDGDATALGVSLTGGAGDGPPLCDSLTAWYDAAFPDAAEAPADGATLARDGADQDAVLVCTGDEVRLGIAPDLATARALAG
jgi:outer membrane murein-binding lipoprotein Lpp